MPTNRLQDHLHSLNNPIVRLDQEQDNLSFVTESANNHQTKREEITINKQNKLHPLVEKLRQQSLNKNSGSESRDLQSPERLNVNLNTNLSECKDSGDKMEDDDYFISDSNSRT